MNTRLQAQEAQLKKTVEVLFGGFMDRHEPARGAGIGSPDVEFLIRPGIGLLPVELKVDCGLSEKGAATLWFRASQIAWHRQFAAAGGIALGLIGVPLFAVSAGGHSKRVTFQREGKTYSCFRLAVTYGFEIGNNQCIWRPINRHDIRGELSKHVAYLESDQGQRAWRGTTSGG